jgi:hypothetical protein
LGITWKGLEEVKKSGVLIIRCYPSPNSHINLKEQKFRTRSSSSHLFSNSHMPWNPERSGLKATGKTALPLGTASPSWLWSKDSISWKANISILRLQRGFLV